MTASYVTVILDLFDGAGNAYTKGTVSWTPSQSFPDVADQMDIGQAPVTATFAVGRQAQVKVIANDTAGPQGVSTPGWTWNVTYSSDTPGQPAAASYYVLSTNGSTQRLSSLASVPAAQPGAQYVPLPASPPADTTKVLGVSQASPLVTAWVASASGSGTVTTVSVASANGFAGTVANPTTTPAISVQTSVTGLLKGNGTAVSAAAAGTDYLTPTGSGAGLTGITAAQVGAARLLTPTAVKTGNYTAAAGDFVPCDTTSAGFTVTLPNAPADLSVVGVKQVIQGGTNTVTIACAGSDVFNKTGGSTSATLTLLAQGMLLQYRASGGIWYVLADDLALPQLDARYRLQPVQAQQYRTTADGANTLTQVTPPAFAALPEPGYQPVIVDPARQYQQILGLGAALTDSAAYVLLNYLSPSAMTSLLQEMYSPSQRGWSTTRIGLGATDFISQTYFSYDTAPSGGTDPTLAQFTLAPDAARVIPVLQQILAINPKVRVFASLWVPPGWTQTFGYAGEYLNTAYAQYYANYIVTTIQAYAALGIPIYAVSPQNEPYQNANYAAQLAWFVSEYLGPAFAAAGLSTLILAGEDNWQYYQEHLAQLSDPAAGPWYGGASFHAYAGTPSQMGQVAAQYPGKLMFLTEMRNMLAESYSTAMGIMAGDVVIGSLVNGASAVTVWNLALDQNGNPSTNNTGRQGVVTVNNSTGVITRNTSYYAISHVAQFSDLGARRIACSTYAAGKSGTQVEAVAWLNSDGSVGLFCYNPAGTSATFNVIDARTNTGFPVTLAAGEISTFTWGSTASLTPSAAPASAPSVPGTPVLTATGQNGQVTLSWAAPSSTVPLTGYTLLRGSSPGTETTLVTLAPGVTSYVDVSGAGTFYYKLTASNGGGTSAASAEQTATAAAVAAPAGSFTVTATGQTFQNALSWPVPADRPLTSIAVYRSTTQGSQGVQIATLPGDATAYTDTTATAGTATYYTVVLTNGAGSGTSTQSSAATATAPASPLVDKVYGQSLPAAATYGAAPSFGWNHLVSTGLQNMMAVVVIASSGTAQATSVKWGGIPMAPVPGFAESGGSTVRTVQAFYLMEPPVGASDVAVQMAGYSQSNIVGTSISFSQVNQAVPFRTAAINAGTAATLSVSTTGGAASDLVLSALASRQAVTSPAGTVQFTQAQSNTFLEVCTQAGSTGTVTSSYTISSSDTMALSAVAIPVAASAYTAPAAAEPVTSGQFLCPPAIYGPSSQARISITAQTFAAVSSSLVNTGEFTAPPSGAVIVKVYLCAEISTAAFYMGLALAAHGTVSPLVAPSLVVKMPSTAFMQNYEAVFTVTSLTPGQVYNFDLLAAVSSTQTLTIAAVASTSLSPAFSDATAGSPLVMTVQAV